jgi:transposase
MADPTRPTDRPVLSSAERRAILAEYDSYPRGDRRRGELLRRHGLYTSQLAKWRQRLAKGETTLEPQPPGPKPEPPNPLAAEVARLQRENARLQAQLAKAETVIDIQKKVAALLGQLPPQPSDEHS